MLYPQFFEAYELVKADFNNLLHGLKMVDSESVQVKFAMGQEQLNEFKFTLMSMWAVAELNFPQLAAQTWLLSQMLPHSFNCRISLSCIIEYNVQVFNSDGWTLNQEFGEKLSSEEQFNVEVVQIALMFVIDK